VLQIKTNELHFRTASPYLIDGISKYIYTCIFFAKQTSATNSAYYFYLGVGKYRSKIYVLFRNRPMV